MKKFEYPAGTVPISHPDHFGGFRNFLERKHDGYELERIVCNLPVLSNYKTTSDEQGWKRFSEIIAKYYPSCIEHKAHVGEVISIADQKLEVLFRRDSRI